MRFSVKAILNDAVKGIVEHGREGPDNVKGGGSAAALCGSEDHVGDTVQQGPFAREAFGGFEFHEELLEKVGALIGNHIERREGILGRGGLEGIGGRVSHCEGHILPQ